MLPVTAETSTVMYQARLVGPRLCSNMMTQRWPRWARSIWASNFSTPSCSAGPQIGKLKGSVSSLGATVPGMAPRARKKPLGGGAGIAGVAERRGRGPDGRRAQRLGDEAGALVELGRDAGAGAPGAQRAV